MLKVKVAEVGEGLHHSEIVVSVQAIGGQQNLIVDKRSISNGTLRVGYPIRQDGGKYLVELPRETVNGSWRIWVAESEIEHERQSAA